MARKMPGLKGTFIQMEDEIASMAAVVGAVWGGAKAMTATSGPGFSLMQEGIGFAAETETPCVIVNVQRGGPSTGQPTLSAQQDVMQAKYGSHGDYEIIALCPGSVQECFDLTVKAFNLAERFRVPVIILSDEIVGHTRERLVIPESPVVVPRAEPLSARKAISCTNPCRTGSWTACLPWARDTRCWWTASSMMKAATEKAAT